MNKYKTTLLITLAALVTPFVTFSQLPGDFGDNTDPNPTDAPVDTNIWILLTIGCVYVGYKLYKSNKKQLTE